MANKKEVTTELNPIEPTPEIIKRSAGIYVADGRSIICKTGVIGAEDGPLKPDQFANGQQTIDTLIKSGHLVKV